jgi:hypothetical protein
MSLGDWQLFWFDHNSRPTLTATELRVFDFEINMDCMRIGFEQWARSMTIQFIPAISSATKHMNAFLVATKKNGGLAE